MKDEFWLCQSSLRKTREVFRLCELGTNFLKMSQTKFATFLKNLCRAWQSTSFVLLHICVSQNIFDLIVLDSDVASLLAKTTMGKLKAFPKNFTISFFYFLTPNSYLLSHSKC